MPDLKTIVVDWLRAHGYSGLWSTEECACTCEDLMPCEQPSIDCEPGYYVRCGCHEGGWHVQAEKPQGD